jgi:nucleoside-diphosphate-sugar epimerase
MFVFVYMFSGTETILKACKEQNVPHLIYCSSLSIFYGPQAMVGGTETTVITANVRNGFPEILQIQYYI